MWEGVETFFLGSEYLPPAEVGGGVARRVEWSK